MTEPTQARTYPGAETDLASSRNPRFCQGFSWPVQPSRPSNREHGTVAAPPHPQRQLGVSDDRVLREYPLSAQHRDDASAGDLQELADVVVGEERQRVEAEPYTEPGRAWLMVSGR